MTIGNHDDNLGWLLAEMERRLGDIVGSVSLRAMPEEEVEWWTLGNSPTFRPFDAYRAMRATWFQSDLADAERDDYLPSPYKASFSD